MKRLVYMLALAALVVGIPAYAHHSFNNYYFESQSTSVEGEVVEFEYRSPHAWVHIMAKNETGQMQKYSAEWSNTNRLKQQGITKDTIKPGDFVVITGSPGRKPEEYRLHLKGIQRPSDGWRWGNGRR